MGNNPCYRRPMKILKYIWFPLVILVLIFIAILSIIVGTAALIIKIFGEAYFTLRAIYEK